MERKRAKGVKEALKIAKAKAVREQERAEEADEALNVAKL